MSVRPRVVVADDHRVMLDILVRALSTEFDVVAAVADGPSAVRAACCFHPDLLVLDIAMPGLNGIGVGLRVKESGSSAKIVFVTTFGDRALLRQALALGDIGFVVKNHLAADLMPAIHSVLTGQSFVSPSLAG